MPSNPGGVDGHHLGGGARKKNRTYLDIDNVSSKASKLMTSLDDYLAALPDEDEVIDEVFKEKFVDLKTWLYAPEYMGLEIRLSTIQYEVLEAMGDYNPKTNPYTEGVCEWGKGSGKDFISALCALRCVYWLLCLRNPYIYYGLAKGTGIQLCNIAYTAEQAIYVYFKQLTGLIKASPWFMKQKPDIKKSRIDFPNEITLVSTSTDGDSAEGQNLIFAVMDEASAFKDSKTIKAQTRKDGVKVDRAADAIYKVLRSSVNSRFPNAGKVLIISYPRYKDDYIETKLAENKEANKGFVSGPYATWEVNPSRKREHFNEDYEKNPELADAMYACVGENTLVNDWWGGLTLIKDSNNSIYKGKKQTFRLKTLLGYEIETTVDHLLLDEYQNWKKLEDYKIGDKISVCQNEQKFGSYEEDLRIDELVGQMVGDGWVGNENNKKPECGWAYATQDMDLIQRHMGFLLELGENFNVSAVRTFSGKKTCTGIRLRNQDAYNRWFTLLEGHKMAWNKRVPSWVMQGTKDVVVAFLRGLFEADGCVNKQLDCSYSSVSFNLVKEVQLLLGLFGITCPIRQHQGKWNESLNARTKTSWTIQLSHVRSRQFFKEIGFISNRKQNRGIELLNSPECKWVRPTHLEYYPDIIVSIEDSGIQDVYDLLDMPNHMFYANGLIAHNCNPPFSEDGWVKYPDRFLKCVANSVKLGTLKSPIDEDGIYDPFFQGIPGKLYCIHVDLALNADKCALSLASQGNPIIKEKCPCGANAPWDERYEVCSSCGLAKEKWLKITMPTMVVSLLKHFKPRNSASGRKEVHFADIREEILFLRDRGHKIWALSYDGWQSRDSIQTMQRLLGKRIIKDRWGQPLKEEEIAQTLSVDRDTKAYDTLKEFIYDERFYITPPASVKKKEDWEESEDPVAIAYREFRGLRLINWKKVDHSLGASKDFTDALAGCAYWVSQMPMSRGRGPSISGWRENMDIVRR